VNRTALDAMASRNASAVSCDTPMPTNTMPKAPSSQRGVDLAIETVGGRIFQQAQRALAPLGRIVIAGMAGGEESQPDIPTLLARSASCATLNLSVVYSQQPGHMCEAWAQLCSLYGAGVLSPQIGNRFPLAQAADAHRLLESRANVGKVLLNPCNTTPA
jgi:NADPH2:quinone reductase